MADYRRTLSNERLMETSWCSANMQITRDRPNSKAVYDPDVFQIQTDVWMDYIATYTEWEVNESDQRIFGKFAETSGNFKIPPNPVFKER